MIRTLVVQLTLMAALALSETPYLTSQHAHMATGMPAAMSEPIRGSDRWSQAWEDLEGWASWYSAQDPGVIPWTANTEAFNDRALTCAMWGVPFNTRLKVTNVVNGRSVVVRVNDRGPAEDLVATQNRVIDLTKAAFAAIADTHQGLVRVRVELAQPLISSAH